MVLEKRFGNSENDEPADDNGTRSRREFLQKAGLIVGGISLFGLSNPLAWAQTTKNCTPVPPSVIPTNCNPPTPPGPAVPFQPDTSLPMRVRKSAFELSPPEVTRLKDAYCELRKLTLNSPNDPRGWMQQANVHCHYCSGPNADTLPEIHNSWLFFPWHRCYLYFHERILAKLINDQTFALSYWDWDTAGRAILPTPFVTPNDPSNPLYDANRGVTPTDQIPSQYVSQSYMYGPDGIMNTPTNLLFMGSPDPDPETTNMQFGGAVEFGPHGVIHLWTGNPSFGNGGNGAPDMGILMTAAQDPVFFAHHSNIDRLWDVWLGNAVPPYQHVNFDDPSWEGTSFTFYDENSKWISMTINDVLDMANSLKYQYQMPSVAQTPEPQPAPQKLTLAAATQKRTAEVQATGTQKTNLGSKPVTKKIKLPADLRTRIRTLAEDRNTKPRLYVLHIDGIEVPPNRSAIVHVFANLPKANAATNTETPNFLGYFTVIAKTTRTGGHNGHRPISVSLHVSNKLSALIKENDDLAITLVPVNGRSGQPQNFKLTFRRVYLSEETY